jgi:hypothetical protein
VNCELKIWITVLGEKVVLGENSMYGTFTKSHVFSLVPLPMTDEWESNWRERMPVCFVIPPHRIECRTPCAIRQIMDIVEGMVTAQFTFRFYPTALLCLNVGECCTPIYIFVVVLWVPSRTAAQRVLYFAGWWRTLEHTPLFTTLASQCAIYT